MKRTEIEVVIKKNSITILTKENQITFSSSDKEVKMFSTAKFSMLLLDEIEATKIVKVDNYSFNETASLILKKQFGYTNQAFIECLVDLIQKHNI